MFTGSLVWKWQWLYFLQSIRLRSNQSFYCSLKCNVWDMLRLNTETLTPLFLAVNGRSVSFVSWIDLIGLNPFRRNENFLPAFHVLFVWLKPWLYNILCVYALQHNQDTKHIWVMLTLMVLQEFRSIFYKTAIGPQRTYQSSLEQYFCVIGLQSVTS